MTIPNILSILRLALVPVMAVLYVKDYMIAALCVFVAASLTDMLDGYIARKYNQITDLGKLLDPLADKLMVLTSLALFYFMDKSIPLFVLLVMVIKEALLVLGGVVVYKKSDFVVVSKIYGKISTFLFMLGVSLTFLSEYTAPYNLYIIYAAFALSIFSFFMYGISAIKRAKKEAKA